MGGARIQVRLDAETLTWWTPRPQALLSVYLLCRRRWVSAPRSRPSVFGDGKRLKPESLCSASAQRTWLRIRSP